VLKLSQDIYLRVALVLLVVFGAVFGTTLCFVELTRKELVVFTLAWSVMFGVVMMMLYYLHSKLKKDVESLRLYLQKLDKKEYKHPLKVTYYMEFLEIALLLKNLTKRLYYKKSKKNIPKK